MSLVYRNAHILFRYPEGWQLEEVRSEDGLTISLQSPGSMLVMLMLYQFGRTIHAIADQALKAMEDEYPHLDSEPVTETIRDMPTVGHDISFISLDLTNTCWIRAFNTPERSVLIFAQTNDQSLEKDEAVFRALCASLELPGSEC